MWFVWAGTLRPKLRVGWAPALPTRFLRFAPTQAPNKVDDHDAPSGEFVIRAPLYVISRGPKRALPANKCASDFLVASVLAVPVAPLPASTEGADCGQFSIPSEPLPSPTDGNAPMFSSVALHLYRRLCFPLPRRGPVRLGLAIAKLPLLASLRPPWAKGSLARYLLHPPFNGQPSRRAKPARLGSPRLQRFLSDPPSTLF